MLDGVNYGYRQHPGQDIKQGDGRSFYSLEMFRLIPKRGVTEGWNDFRPVLQCFINSVNWCWTGLRPDLRPAFVQGAAELWVYAQNTLGAGTFNGLALDQFAPPDFAYYVAGFNDRLKTLENSYGSIYLDSINMHPGMLAKSGAKGTPGSENAYSCISGRTRPPPPSCKAATPPALNPYRGWGCFIPWPVASMTPVSIWLQR